MYIFSGNIIFILPNDAFFKFSAKVYPAKFCNRLNSVVTSQINAARSQELNGFENSLYSLSQQIIDVVQTGNQIKVPVQIVI